jgi:hypothetical protein
MSAAMYLVWILVVGEAGGHNGSAQFGPFVNRADCEKVSESKVLRNFDKECIQINFVPSGR